jgi:hypothetical protein
MRGRERSLEWWIAILRLAAIPFAVAQVATTKHYPPHYEAIAWALTLVLAVAAVALFAAVRRGESRAVQLTAMIFDFSIISAFSVLYAFELGTPARRGSG